MRVEEVMRRAEAPFWFKVGHRMAVGLDLLHQRNCCGLTLRLIKLATIRGTDELCAGLNVEPRASELRDEFLPFKPLSALKLAGGRPTHTI